MGDCPHQAAVLHDGAPAHPLHDAARLGQQFPVHHPEDHVAAGVRIADLLNFDPVSPGRLAGGGRPDLSVPSLHLLRKGHLHLLACKLGAGAAVDAVFPIDPDGADGVGTQEAAFQLSGTACRPLAASGDLAGHDLAAAQGDALPGIAVTDGMAQPREHALFLVGKGQGPHPC